MGMYYLAVDIGASSGRHILGSLENGKLKLEEIYRFENGMTNKDGKLLWNTKKLFQEILNGMKRCSVLGKIPVSMSIDTWAVDYVLLDKKNQILGESFGYRDQRTRDMDKMVYERIPEKELYRKTGIQKQIFNTIYQLMAVKTETPGIMEASRCCLMLPDFFQFLLTGNKVSEYTNATTTQLVNPVSKQWDADLIQRLGYPPNLFCPLQMPGTEVGELKQEIQEQVGFNCKVLLCASHDTASAVMAVPSVGEDAIYISSGTWSLMGIELKNAKCDEDSRQANFTNEGGYDYRFRYLKNIMGLWMIQSVRHELKDAFSFAELCKMAEEYRDFPARVDVNNERFMAPKNMTREIQEYCMENGQKVPKTTGEVAAVVYQSLAECYGKTVREIERIQQKQYKKIHVIGGGSKAEYLNQLTANVTGKMVYAGPGEATAIGNLLAQMIKTGCFESLAQARACVYKSFDVKSYQPEKK